MTKKLTTEEFKTKVLEKYPEQDLDLSETIYDGYFNDVEIRCRKHGVFKMAPSNLLGKNRYGCPKCHEDERRIELEKKLKERVLAKFPDQDLDLSGTRYEDMYTDVEIVCRKHGLFTVKPRAIMRNNGCGCPECAKEKKRREAEAEFVKRLKEKFGDKYWCEEMLYINADAPVKFICHELDDNGNEHGEFWMTPHDILRKTVIYGCAKCRMKAMTKDVEQFKDEVRKRHPNAKWDLSRVKYMNSYTEVEFYCLETDENGVEHGSFWVTPDNILSKASVHGCWRCAAKATESGLEKETAKLLDSLGITYEHPCKKRILPWLGLQHLDFYITDLNIAIECQGRQHYEPVAYFGGQETFERIIECDQRKRQLCEKNGVKLFYIRYDDDVEERLNEILRRNHEYREEIDLC